MFNRLPHSTIRFPSEHLHFPQFDDPAQRKATILPNDFRNHNSKRATNLPVHQIILINIHESKV